MSKGLDLFCRSTAADFTLMIDSGVRSPQIASATLSSYLSMVAVTIQTLLRLRALRPVAINFPLNFKAWFLMYSSASSRRIRSSWF